ncbi:tRNA-2-methylthio-N6-dimethylallyladenosine synthase [Roseospirillum parvum]|uniref:tRNA-2-methylthio-N(6)-dimethylallyladenosine synthase n=2 Tax=Roseospirillum parvum TaxID=83401 RepID=A0A1G8DN64_9PROT|nr:tRNA-2-methylthio-N6-dimethylallyladenosine synthase [Roseospirillum parvum]
MNVHDSARMADVMAPLGYALTEDAGAADIVLLNTCHIREKAAEKVYSELGRLRRRIEARRRAGGETLLAVAGCVAQAEGPELLARAPFVDLVLGPLTLFRLPEFVAQAHRALAAGACPVAADGGRKGLGLIDTDFPAEPKFDHLPAPGVQGPSAFLSIQEGCDRFCTFCVVPYTRGAEYCRPAADIIAEAEALIAGGAVEITLLGQNVNGWRDADGTRFGDLLRRLAGLPGLKALRYTTSHPREVDDALIAAHGELQVLVPFLHLPVQSGSDRILKAMNRGHTAAHYLDLVARLKAARPGLMVSSDFIVGFPGESEADFAATLEVVERADVIQAFAFKYSPRPGTPAASLPDQVPEAVKEERLARLMARLDARQMAFNQASVGRRFPVLLDRPGRRPGQLVGRSPYMQPVHVMTETARLGELVEVEIEAAHPHSLAGVILEAPPRQDPERACA